MNPENKVPKEGQIWYRFRALWPKRQNELVVINYYYADDETVSYTFLEDGWVTSAILFDFLSEFSLKISPGKIWKELNES